MARTLLTEDQVLDVMIWAEENIDLYTNVLTGIVNDSFMFKACKAQFPYINRGKFEEFVWEATGIIL